MQRKNPPASMLCLVDHNQLRPVAALRHRPIVIGRDQECDIVLRDARTSRRHACIFERGRHYYIVDLRSTVGTRVNNTPVGTRPIMLHDHDRIEINDVELMLLQQETSSPENAAKATAVDEHTDHLETLLEVPREDLSALETWIEPSRQDAFADTELDAETFRDPAQRE